MVAALDEAEHLLQPLIQFMVAGDAHRLQSRPVVAAGLALLVTQHIEEHDAGLILEQCRLRLRSADMIAGMENERLAPGLGGGCLEMGCQNRGAAHRPAINRQACGDLAVKIVNG